jgi:aminoglycoside/choline kinase family phosphotransferase
MSELRPELLGALARLHADARVETLQGDASARRFHRLYLAEGGTRIVMDYGAPFTGETDDVRLARIFERADLPVARVLDVLGEAGCLLLEDLGDVTLEAAQARDTGDLYDRAVELAAAIAARGTRSLSASDRAGGPALDAERLSFEMRFFCEHFLCGWLKAPPPPETTVALLEELAIEVASHPRVMCHRDYHSRNLMVRGDGSLAMVDIQDARWGPDTYDVASLLRDAYVDLDDRWVEELLARYIEAMPGRPDAETVHRRFHLAATQRMIKALGTFGYQITRLGRTRYSDAIPRTLQRLDRVLPAQSNTREIHAALRASGVFA